MSKGQSMKKLSKMSAFEVDYSFYFKNNQGMFVVQSQINYLDMMKAKKKRNIAEYLQSIPQFKEMKKELF